MTYATDLFREGTPTPEQSSRARTIRANDALFCSIAAEVDPGWQLLLEKRAELETIIASKEAVMGSAPDSAQIVDKFIEREGDLVRLLESYLQSEKEIAHAERFLVFAQTFRHVIAQRAWLWLAANEQALRSLIQRSREDLVTRMREALVGLDGVHEAADLATRPTAATAFAAASELLREWRAWKQLHLAVIGFEEVLGKDRKAFYPGLTWSKAPIDVDDSKPIDDLRAICKAKIWTPSVKDLEARMKSFRSTHERQVWEETHV